mmetsp:Transcript_31244/g.71269  ORF Transcript_31244/g.71269 Transcript_31244/m.71269 type:complete len:581 (+) Transcript_31244:3216-4958(+)
MSPPSPVKRPPGCFRPSGADQRGGTFDSSHLLWDRVAAAILLAVHQLDPLTASDVSVGPLALSSEGESSPSHRHRHPRPVACGIIDGVGSLAGDGPGGTSDPSRPRADVRHGLLPPPLPVGIVVRLAAAGLGGLGALIPHEDVALQEAVPGVHEVLPGMAPLVHVVQAELLARARAGDWHVVLHDLAEDLSVNKTARHRQIHTAPGELPPGRHLPLGPLRHSGDPELHVGVRPVGPARRRHVHAAAALHQRIAGSRKDTALHGDLLGARVLARALGDADASHIHPLRRVEAEPDPGPGALVPVAVQAPTAPRGGVVPIQDVVDAVGGAGTARVDSAVVLHGHAQGAHVNLPCALLLAIGIHRHARVEGHVVDLPAEAQGLRVVEQDVLVPSSHVPLLDALAIGRLLEPRQATAGEPTDCVGAHPAVLGHLAGVGALRALVQVHRGDKIRVGIAGGNVPPPASVGVGGDGGLLHTGRKCNLRVHRRAHVLHVDVIFASSIADVVKRTMVKPEDLEGTVVGLDLEGHRHSAARRLERSLAVGRIGAIVSGTTSSAQIVLAHAVGTIVHAEVLPESPDRRALI